MTEEEAGRVDLAVVWLPDTPVDEAQALRAQLGERGVVYRASEGDHGVAVLFSGEEASGDLDSLSAAVAAVVGTDVDARLYWRRITTDAARAGRFDLAPYLFSVRVGAPPQWQQPIRQWLDDEHFDLQTASLVDVMWSEGYEPQEGEFHFLNLWAMRDPAVIDSPAWITVRDTPGWDAVRPGFQASHVIREIYRVVPAPD